MVATPVLGSLLVSMGHESEVGVAGGGVTVPKEISVLSSFCLLQQMEKPGLSMAPLSSVEQTQMPAKRWVLKRVREWLEEGHSWRVALQ